MYDSSTPDKDHPLYRIGRAVHDHEARLRILEHDSVKVFAHLDAVDDKLSRVESTLTKHVEDDSKALGRIISSVWVQFLIVIGTLATIAWEIHAR